MKRILTIIAIAVVVALAGSSSMLAKSAQSWEGTWKLDVSRSKGAPNQPLDKSATAVITAQGDNYDFSITGTDATGKDYTVKYSIPKQGGAVSYTEGYPAGYASNVTMGKRTMDSTDTLNGKQVSVVHIVRRGNTARRTVKGTDAQGKHYKVVETFVKQ